jgi:hypothetical protein
MFNIIWQTLKKPTRSLPALLVGFLIYSFIVLIPHIDTLAAFTGGDSWTIALRLAWGLLIGNAALVGLGPYTVFLVLILSLCISIALLIEVVVLKRGIVKVIPINMQESESKTATVKVIEGIEKSSEKKKKGTLSSAFALLMAFFGYGCAACGTAISATVFNALGLSFIASWLPLRGMEFSLLGIALVFISWKGLVKQIQGLKTPVCEV